MDFAISRAAFDIHPLHPVHRSPSSHSLDLRIKPSSPARRPTKLYCACLRTGPDFTFSSCSTEMVKIAAAEGEESIHHHRRAPLHVTQVLYLVFPARRRDVCASRVFVESHMNHLACLRLPQLLPFVLPLRRRLRPSAMTCHSCPLVADHLLRKFTLS